MDNIDWCRDQPEEAALHIYKMEDELSVMRLQLALAKDVLQRALEEITATGISEGVLFGPDQFVDEKIKQALATIDDAKLLDGYVLCDAEPVAAQHRFRHTQKSMPDWSAWQLCEVSNRPSWSVDSVGYEVEYMPLYTKKGLK